MKVWSPTVPIHVSISNIIRVKYHLDHKHVFNFQTIPSFFNSVGGLIKASLSIDWPWKKSDFTSAASIFYCRWENHFVLLVILRILLRLSLLCCFSLLGYFVFFVVLLCWASSPYFCYFNFIISSNFEFLKIRLTLFTVVTIS